MAAENYCFSFSTGTLNGVCMGVVVGGMFDTNATAEQQQGANWILRPLNFPIRVFRKLTYRLADMILIASRRTHKLTL